MKVDDVDGIQSLKEPWELIRRMTNEKRQMIYGKSIDIPSSPDILRHKPELPWPHVYTQHPNSHTLAPTSLAVTR